MKKEYTMPEIEIYYLTNEETLGSLEVTLSNPNDAKANWNEEW